MLFRSHRPALENDPSSSTKIIVQHSRLTIATKPEGALVYVDDTYKGKAPVAMDTPYGSHEVRITREGYFEQAFQLKIDQPEVNLSRRLIPAN